MGRRTEVETSRWREGVEFLLIDPFQTFDQIDSHLDSTLRSALDLCHVGLLPKEPRAYHLVLHCSDFQSGLRRSAGRDR